MAEYFNNGLAPGDIQALAHPNAEEHLSNTEKSWFIAFILITFYGITRH